MNDRVLLNEKKPMISKKGYQPEGTEEVFVVSCVVPEIVYTYRVKSQLC